MGLFPWNVKSLIWQNFGTRKNRHYALVVNIHLPSNQSCLMPDWQTRIVPSPLMLLSSAKLCHIPARHFMMNTSKLLELLLWWRLMRLALKALSYSRPRMGQESIVLKDRINSMPSIKNCNFYLKNPEGPRGTPMDPGGWFFPSSPFFYPLSRSWSFNLSCPRRLASQLELGSQVGSTTDHLSSCCPSNTPKINFY